MLVVVFTMIIAAAYLDACMECAEKEEWRQVVRDLVISIAYLGIGVEKLSVIARHVQLSA